jgi:enoyl-CoA hydratase
MAETSDMSEDAVLYERRDASAVLTINRPKTLNALDLPTLDALEAALRKAAADKDVQVVILTGAGRAFVAGGDIADLTSRQGLAHYLEFGERIHEVFRQVEMLDKPTIAAINGWALGGGTELLLCTDLRIVAKSAMLGLPEITLGLFPGAGGSQRLMRQVSPCKSRELMFLGERITAQEAERLGLVNQVVEDGEALDAALAMAATT